MTNDAAFHTHGAKFLMAWVGEDGSIHTYGTITNAEAAEWCKGLAPDFEKWAEEDLHVVTVHEKKDG